MGAIQKQYMCLVCGESVPPGRRAYCSEKCRRWWNNRKQADGQMLLRRDKIMWSAGFVDGEGYIGLTRRKHRKDSYTLRMAVCNRDITPLNRLIELFGGIIRTDPLKRDNWAQTYTWVMVGVHAASAIVQLRPFLLVKKQQADLAIQYASLRKGHRYRPKTDDEQLTKDDIWQQFKKLNAKGR